MKKLQKIRPLSLLSESSPPCRLELPTRAGSLL